MRAGIYLGTGVVLLAIFGGVMYYFLSQRPEPLPESTPIEVAEQPEETFAREERVIGKSVEGRDIEAVTFGKGDTHMLFVGGMHGGYEWNSVLLAYEFIDYVDGHPEVVPEDLMISVIPNLNPDGLALVTGSETTRLTLADIPDPSIRVAEGRFNAHNVDLNRNFDCKWTPTSTWRGNEVSAGTAPFSEPEARALRNFIADFSPEAVIFWHSQANNVYASECENGVLPQTLTLMSTYAQAAGYGEVPVFDAYPVTGDAEGWLASLGIPAITVELETHNSIEWTRNLAAIDAVIGLYSKAK